jgi:hypothetical protein
MGALRLVVAVAIVLCLPGRSYAEGVGVTPDGKKGRIHTVARGDTLWDISATYLGTPWVWPSVWKENEGIENPHRIYPGDLIWITEGEMRKLTPEEAEMLLRRGRELAQESAEGPVETPPAAPAAAETSLVKEDPFAALDQGEGAAPRALHFDGLHRFSFVDQLEAPNFGAVMGNHDPNYWASQNQTTIVSLGEGQVRVGDSFTIFRPLHRVKHPETGETLGHFIEVLGRAEISEVHAEASFARVVTSYAEIAPGDRVMPYEMLPSEIVESPAGEDVEGTIVAFQPNRIRTGEGDMVILDRGTRDGVTSGRRFDLFRPGREARDPATLTKVLVPDDVIGGLFVMRASEKTSLALITRSRTDVIIGDHFRSRR